MSVEIRIYKLGRATDIWFWLCKRCLRAMEAEGWVQRAALDPPHDLKCDGEACVAARKAA